MQRSDLCIYLQIWIETYWTHIKNEQKYGQIVKLCFPPDSADRLTGHLNLGVYDFSQ